MPTYIAATRSRLVSTALGMVRPGSIRVATSASGQRAKPRALHLRVQVAAQVDDVAAGRHRDADAQRLASADAHLLLRRVDVPARHVRDVAEAEDAAVGPDRQVADLVERPERAGGPQDDAIGGGLEDEGFGEGLVGRAVAASQGPGREGIGVGDVAGPEGPAAGLGPAGGGLLEGDGGGGALGPGGHHARQGRQASAIASTRRGFLSPSAFITPRSV